MVAKIKAISITIPGLAKNNKTPFNWDVLLINDGKKEESAIKKTGSKAVKKLIKVPGSFSSEMVCDLKISRGSALILRRDFENMGPAIIMDGTATTSP